MGKPEKIIEMLEGKPDGELESDVVGDFTTSSNTRKLRKRVREKLGRGKQLIIKNGKWIILALALGVIFYINTPMINYFSSIMTNMFD